MMKIECAKTILVGLVIKNIFRYVVLIATLVLFGGCKGCKGFKSFTEKDRRVMIVLIDYSASTSDAVLDNYVHVVNETILSNLKPYDCLIVVPIDEGSKMQPVKLFYKDLADTTFRNATDGFAHADDSLNLRFKNYVREAAPMIEKELKEQKIKRKRYTYHTDIIGALQQTTNLIEFNSKQGMGKDIKDFVLGHVKLKSENIIVILSDMIQDSDGLAFGSKKGVTGEQTEIYLNKLVKESRIPELNWCKVFAIGATGKNSIQIDNINFFWRKYFERTNAELKAYGYNVEDKLRKYLKGSSD